MISGFKCVEAQEPRGECEVLVQLQGFLQVAVRFVSLPLPAERDTQQVAGESVPVMQLQIWAKGRLSLFEITLFNLPPGLFLYGRSLRPATPGSQSQNQNIQ